MNRSIAFLKVKRDLDFILASSKFTTKVDMTA
jgi:hypothetical protein